MEALKLRVLIVCEFSGAVRDAFDTAGHRSWSCDLLPTETNGNHYQGDCFCAIRDLKPDFLGCHPPCTHLASSGARWMKAKGRLVDDSVDFCKRLMDSDVPMIYMENPIGVLSTRYRKPDQIIHPWQFGHGETKATCLWLKGLPLLKPTNIVEGREQRVFRMPPSPTRWKERSRTYSGIAAAMADQWGKIDA